MTPQLILVLLTAISLGMNIAKHGEPRDDHNGWSSFIAFIIIHGILYWGGFYNNF